MNLWPAGWLENIVVVAAAAAAAAAALSLLECCG
jgi:hypothetical protein